MTLYLFQPYKFEQESCWYCLWQGIKSAKFGRPQLPEHSYTDRRKSDKKNLF
jgi:hypothetical protein